MRASSLPGNSWVSLGSDGLINKDWAVASLRQNVTWMRFSGKRFRGTPFLPLYPSRTVSKATPPPQFNGLLCRAFGMASSPTSAADALDYFNEFGIFYLEDAAIGRAVQQIDDLGLSTSLQSWDNVKNIIVGNPVSAVARRDLSRLV